MGSIFSVPEAGDELSHSIEMVSPEDENNPIQCNPIIRKQVETIMEEECCSACRNLVQGYIKKSYALFCMEEAKVSRGFAVNSSSGELIALYEGLAQVTRELCIKTQSMAAAPSAAMRHLAALMQSRVLIVRELIRRGQLFIPDVACETVLPLSSRDLELQHASEDLASDEAVHLLCDEAQQLGLSHAIVTALRFVNKYYLHQSI